jgi:hypothetical protein
MFSEIMQALIDAEKQIDQLRRKHRAYIEKIRCMYHEADAADNAEIKRYWPNPGARDRSLQGTKAALWAVLKEAA